MSARIRIMYCLLLLLSAMAYVAHASEGNALIPAGETCKNQPEGPSAALLQFDSMESMLTPDTPATREVLIGSALRRLKRKRMAPYENCMVKVDACHRVHVHGAQQMLNNLEGFDCFMQTLAHRSVFQIDLSHNLLESPFPAGCLASLRCLKKLNVSHNQLPELPDLKYLGMLEYFDGSYNKISSINLQEALPTNTLKYIDLGHNHIKIVKDVGKWCMAKKGLVANRRGHYYVCNVALLDHNEITLFPETLCGIGQQNKLCLGLFGNPINEDSLPKKLTGCAFLAGGYIDLRQAPIKGRVAKKLQNGWNDSQATSARIIILSGEGGNTEMNATRSKWPTYFHDEQPNS